MDTLATLVASARATKGLTLRQVEAETGIKNAHLSQIESGKIKRPSTAILYGLSSCLDLDYHQLLRASGRIVSASSSDVSPDLHGLAAYRGKLTVDQLAELERFAEMLVRRDED